MIVLVCGGREFNNRRLLNEVLDDIDWARGPIMGLIHGYGRGADMLADAWMVFQIAKDKREHGKSGRWLSREPADWSRHGRAAGPIRNQYMLDAHPGIQLVVAFPGGRGTADMVDRARAKGIETIEIKAEEDGTWQRTGSKAQ